MQRVGERRLHCPGCLRPQRLVQQIAVDAHRLRLRPRREAAGVEAIAQVAVDHEDDFLELAFEHADEARGGAGLVRGRPEGIYVPRKAFAVLLVQRGFALERFPRTAMLVALGVVQLLEARRLRGAPCEARRAFPGRTRER